MTPKDAADGLIYGFEDIGVKFTLVLPCAMYACLRILGQFPYLNKDGTESEEHKFWLGAYNYLKDKQS